MTTIKIAITGDTHADHASRFEEHSHIMGWMLGDAVSRGCALFVHSGDVYERKSMSLERAAVGNWAQSVAAIMPLVLVAGNHDDPLDIDALGQLKARHRIYGVTRPETLTVAGVDLFCVPWPRKGWLLSQASEATREEADALAVEALRAVMRGQMKDLDSPKVFLAHAMMRGSKTSNSQPPLVGSDLELSLEDLALVNADLYVLGHIHMEQRWEIGKAPVVYPGAPRHCNWGELEEKGYMVATFEDGVLEDIEFIPTPCRKMIAMEGTFQGDGFYGDDGHPLALAIVENKMQDCEIRFRYRCTVDERTAAKACANQIVEKLKAHDVRSVKLEERVIVETRARAPEVAKAQSVADKLRRYWDSQGDDGPTPEQRERSLACLDEAEEAS